MTILNDTRRADFFKEVRRLGKQDGEGTVSRPTVIINSFLAAADGYIVSGKTTENDDVAQIYDAYMKARDKEDSFAVPQDDKARGQQISKWRPAALVGGMPIFQTSRNGNSNTVAKDFSDLIQECIVEVSLALGKKLSVADKFIACMHAQRKKVNKLKINEPLTRDEILAALKPSKKVKEELKELRKLIASMSKFAEVWEDSGEAIELALEQLAPRVKELQDEAEGTALDNTVASLTPEQMERVEAQIAAAKQAAAMKLAAE